VEVRIIGVEAGFMLDLKQTSLSRAAFGYSHGNAHCCRISRCFGPRVISTG
jgi:hypothetical protein